MLGRERGRERVVGLEVGDAEVQEPFVERTVRKIGALLDKVDVDKAVRFHLVPRLDIVEIGTSGEPCIGILFEVRMRLAQEVEDGRPAPADTRARHD